MQGIPLFLILTVAVAALAALLQEKNNDGMRIFISHIIKVLEETSVL